jgi:hypothetical protein
VELRMTRQKKEVTVRMRPIVEVQGFDWGEQDFVVAVEM